MNISKVKLRISRFKQVEKLFFTINISDTDADKKNNPLKSDVFKMADFR